MNDLSKNLYCLVMRNGIQIWKEKERLEKIMLSLGSGQRFVEIDGEFVNTADILGIFTPQTMEELNRRKNGQWKCEYGQWHERHDKCEHWKPELENWTGKTPKSGLRRVKEIIES